MLPTRENGTFQNNVPATCPCALAPVVITPVLDTCVNPSAVLAPPLDTRIKNGWPGTARLNDIVSPPPTYMVGLLPVY